jgi:uncharacterized protein
VIRWADPAAVARAVADYAGELRRDHPGIRRILWYGSWVSGRPTPTSDVDLCIVVRAADRRVRDRTPDFLPDRFPLPLDLLVVTEEELGAMASRSPSWHQAIVSGREM